MNDEIRCADCGEMMEVSDPQVYPGTSDLVRVAEPCCDTEETMATLISIKEVLEDKLGLDTAFAFITETIGAKHLLDEDVVKEIEKDLKSIRSNIDDIEEKIAELLGEIE